MRYSCTGIAIATLLAAAGSTSAQFTPRYTEDHDGAMPMRHWTISSLDRLQLGGPVEPVPPRLSGTFIPCGTEPEADSHSAAAYLPDGSALVVANRASKNLTLFNPTTRALIRNIPLSGSPQSLAISTDGSRAITANLFEGTASIINLTTGAEIAVVPVGLNPATARLTPSGATAIIHNNGGGGSLSVIDMASAAVVRTIATGGVQTTFSANFESQGIGFKSTGPALADESTAVFPDYTGSRLLVINIATGAATPVSCAANPTGIAIRGSKAYVTHYNTVRVVSVLDIPSATISQSFTSTTDLQGPIAVNGAGTVAAVAVLNNTQMLDLNTGAFTGNLGPPSNPNDLITTADGNRVLVVGFFGTIFDYATQTVIGSPNQFVSCTVGAVSPLGTQAAMFSDTFGEDMVILNTASATQLSAGPTGPVPEGDKSRVAALTPDGSKAVIVNQFSQTATIINTANNAVLATAATGRRPGSAAITPDGSKAVIANRDGTDATVINLSTFASTSVPISTRGDQVRISPDNQFAYIAVVSGGDGVWRINLNTLAPQGPKLTTGDMGSYFQGYSSFSGIALSPDGATLITCDSFTQQLSVIDTAGWFISQTVSLGAGRFPARAVFSPDGSRIYVSNRDNDTISVIEKVATVWTVTGTINVGDSPTELAITPNGSRLYVMNTGTGVNVGVINTTSLSQTATIPFATNPNIDGIAVSADGSKLFVAHSNGAYTIGGGGFTISQSGILSVVDTATNGILENVTLPNLASGLAIAGNGSFLAMPNLMSEGSTLVSLGGTCYANCDASTLAPVLNVNDFTCFLNRYAAADPYANCDASTITPVLNINDFTCFINKYAAGCP